ncbi:ABC transporter ATPase [Lutibacter sp.]
MIVTFKEISQNSKLWIFPSSRKFYPEELPEIKNSIEVFLTSWLHNSIPLKCAYQLKYGRFIIITVDDTENNLSLEAHNLLIEFIQELEKSLKVILLDKINVCYKQGEFVQYKDLKDFKKMIKSKGVSQKTIVFNNLITTKGELKQNWEINIMDSWLGHFLK